MTHCLLKSTKKCLLLATPSSSMYVSGVHVLKGLVGAGIHCGLSRTLGGPSGGVGTGGDAYAVFFDLLGKSSTGLSYVCFRNSCKGCSRQHMHYYWHLVSRSQTVILVMRRLRPPKRRSGD